jgi:uncharacterized protein YbaA (DUF1428 family)
MAVWALYIPEEHLDAFVGIWRQAQPIYEEHGIRHPSLLMPIEDVADNYGCGPLASCVRRPDTGEVLLLGFDMFDSREDCDRVMAAAMSDERLIALSGQTEPIFGADYSSAMFRGEYMTID